MSLVDSQAGSLCHTFRLWSIVTLLVVTAIFSLGCRRPKSNPVSPASLTPEIIRLHNEGVALMGKFDYAAAHTVFEKLLKQLPDRADLKVDLAIATLNRREQGDAEIAMKLLDEVIAAEPNNLRAYYCRGILGLDRGDPESALQMFSKVADADPTDGYAVYYTGQCLSQLSKIDEALEKFKASVKLDPYFRSGYYGVFQSLLRLGKASEANEYRLKFEKLADNPQARLAEIKYTRMGPKAMVKPIATAIAKPVEIPQGPIFSHVSSVDVTLPAGWNWNEIAATSVTCADLDSDGDLDLLLTSAAKSGDVTKNVVLVREQDQLVVDATHPLASITDVNSVLWGDFDNDGRNDAYFCRAGNNQLWQQTEANRWEDVTATTLTDGADINTVDGAMVDADHDGDLDIFLVNDGPNELLSNNLNGTFRPLAAEYGLAGNVRSKSVLFCDLDHDRDADIVVVNAEPPHQVFINDRLWNYHAATGVDDLNNAIIRGVVSGDHNSDGQFELYTCGNGEVQQWEPDDDGTWKASRVSTDGMETDAIAIADVDADRRAELLVSTKDAIHVLSIDSGKSSQTIPRMSSNAKWLLSTHAHAGPTLYSESSQGLMVHSPGSGRGQFVSLWFSGKEDQGQQMRSNSSGIGVNAAVRSGSRWFAFDTFRSSSGPGQSLQPTQIGLGTDGRLDFVQMTWPDGVFQTEVGIRAGQSHRIEETQRQVASCPVVFAWNGEKHEFVTDVLGVGGIGFNVGKGEYGPPRPWENLLLSESALVPKDGRYEILVGEPMEEVCYLDAARLVAYDLPPDWKLVLDERFAAGVPEPTGKPIFYQMELVPTKATNDRGDDILLQLQHADLKAADPGDIDHRFIGRTRKPHSITLTFDTPLDQIQNPVLVFDGWIEYPYSQTMFAAWQAGATYDSPTIEALDGHGKWKKIVEQFGYMAGMPRRSALPLPTFSAGTRSIRISSNVEIYWDRLSIVDSQTCPDIRRTDLKLESAVVAEAGFAQRSTFDQRRPYYDYDQRSPFWDTRHMTGFYTSFGPALPLVENVDDAVAIIGPGEEVQLKFKASEVQRTANWNRQYVLELNGWAKDEDLFTQDGETVGPLPARQPGSKSATREKLHREFNSRFRSGY